MPARKYGKELRSEHIFIYDKLMLKEIQDMLKIDLTFITYGYTQGAIRSINEGYQIVPRDKPPYYTKKLVQRKVLHTHNTKRFVFGAVFKMNRKIDLLKICSYYYSSLAATSDVSALDLNIPCTRDITSFTMNDVDDIYYFDYVKTGKINALCFIANTKNKSLRTDKQRTFEAVPLDMKSMMGLINENSIEEREEKEHGME